jgi:hypothetical protein
MYELCCLFKASVHWFSVASTVNETKFDFFFQILSAYLSPTMRFNCVVLLQMFLLFGKGGWICGLMAELLTKQGLPFKIAESRMENREAVARFVQLHFTSFLLAAE